MSVMLNRVIGFLAFLLLFVGVQASEIHDAVRAGDLAKVASLLEKNPNVVNEKDERGWTPLLYACGRASGLEMVQLLVGRGADINASHKYGGTVLDRAYESGDDAIFQYLQARGGRFTPIDMGSDAIRGHLRRLTFRWGMRNNVTVSAGPDGVLIVDSGFGKRAAEELQKELQRLSQGELRFIVNSHAHSDHTAGNFLAGIQTRLLDFASLQRPDEAGGIARIQKPSVGTKGKSFLEYYSLRFNGEEIRIIPSPGMHSDRDILVHFTGAGVVFMGDLLLSQNCPALDKVAEYMDFLETAIDVFPESTIFISGHGRDLTHNGLRGYRDVLQQMIDVVRREAAGGKGLEQMLRDDVLKSFKNDYSFLDWLGPDTWLRAVVRRLILKSAAFALEQSLADRGVEAAQAEFRKNFLGNKDYDVNEGEINALGYRLLQQEGKTTEAVAIFTLNTEAFPQSWNTWDSLGEALWNAGEFDKAEAYYEKSLALNPASPSGKAALSQLRGRKLDFRNETGEAARFAPGQSTGLRGPYVGQEPPGNTPRVFAPGIVSTAGHFEFSQTFSPEGKEFYFTQRRDPGGKSTLMVCRLEAKGWAAPREAEVAQGFPCNEPHITPDGGKLFFGSWRPRSENSRAEYGIWVAERKGTAWSEPHYHGPGMFVSMAANGDLYLNDITNAAGGGIVRYPYRDGSYGKPEKLGGGVNSPRPGAHACVAADGRYIVFDSYNRPGGQGGEGDLWVCFRQPDGSWGEAFNLGDAVNTPATNFCPALSPDGKYLFFSTYRDIYWVSSKVIDELRPKK